MSTDVTDHLVGDADGDGRWSASARETGRAETVYRRRLSGYNVDIDVDRSAQVLAATAGAIMGPRGGEAHAGRCRINTYDGGRSKPAAERVGRPGRASADKAEWAHAASRGP